jgi:hypothetical protein
MREKVKEVFDEALRFIADFSLCPLSPLCSLSFKERGGVRVGGTIADCGMWNWEFTIHNSRLTGSQLRVRSQGIAGSSSVLRTNE